MTTDTKKLCPFCDQPRIGNRDECGGEGEGICADRARYYDRANDIGKRACRLLAIRGYSATWEYPGHIDVELRDGRIVYGYEESWYGRVEDGEGASAETTGDVDELPPGSTSEQIAELLARVADANHGKHRGMRKVIRTLDELRAHITDPDAVKTAIYNWRMNEFAEADIVDMLADDVFADGTVATDEAVAAWIAAEYPVEHSVAEHVIAQLEGLPPDAQLRVLDRVRELLAAEVKS